MISRRNFLLFASALIVLLAYLLPEWAAFVRSEVFVFVNGWDEETYLSWQGILGGRNELGYYNLYLFGLLHEVGLSGSMQNLLFDTFLPPLTALLVMQSFHLCGIERPRAFAYAVLVLFSSTLFNYANPIIKSLLGEYDGTAFLMAGWELYPAILRTPNPQVSYFLVALAVYAWLKWRKFWLLVLPLPVLYYFVAVPYVFLIAVGMTFPVVRRKFGILEWQALVASALVIYLVMALGAVVLFTIAGYYDPQNWVTNNAWVYAKMRMPQLPLVLLFMLPVILGLWHFNQLDSDKSKAAMLALVLAALAAVNLHAVTGFMVSQKNYYDYGLSILFGLMLVSMLELLKPRQLAERMLLFLLVIVAVPTLASHAYFYHRAMTISAKMAPFIDVVRNDPMHAIIPDLEVSSRMAYSTAQLLAPPFSYQYYFPFIEKQCSDYPELVSDALRYARQNLPSTDVKALEETTGLIRKNQFESRAMPYKNFPYCQQAFRGKAFNTLSRIP